MKRSWALESLPPSLNQANVGLGKPVAPQGSRMTSPFVTSVVSGRSVMVGLEKNLCWAAGGDEPAVSEVGDGDEATVTLAASLSKFLPEAEARHLERFAYGVGAEKSPIQINCTG